jgi:outer membrane protein insertion porin family
VVGGAAAGDFRLLVRFRAAWLALLIGVSAILLGDGVLPALAQNEPGPQPPAAIPAAHPPVLPAPPQAPPPVQARPGRGTIADIRVVGNHRIEASTIRSYMLVQPGDPFDPDRLDRSLKTLYATGLFSDVRLRREGDTLVVEVKENPIVNRVAFEGNRKINDQTLRGEVQLKPRGVYTPALAQADRQRILNLYASRGRYNARVEPEIIKLSQNRVDVVFKITEGPTTLISRIVFVGNHAFSESRLREVIDTRETRWWRFLSSSDEYDPQRIDFDKELLRRFYLRNGYVDFAVTNATAELAPDRSAFFVTYTLHEGARYRVSKVSVTTTLHHVDPKALEKVVDIAPGDWYDGDAVERNVQKLTDAVGNQGIAFVDVKPRITRDPKKHTVDLVFEVAQAPRVYVERIDIVGNTRTKDKVIRREFRFAEGDAYNDALVRRTKQSLTDLNYFSSVDITHAPGSAPDRTVVTANIGEKATGELTIGGGYSTDVGALANIGLHEKNFIGTGIDAGINTILAQLESQIDLSLTDPYFLDRNIVAGTDLFYIDDNLQYVSEYNERRYGVTLRAGYSFSDHLRQALTYSAVSRTVYGILSTASPYVAAEQGTTVISQVGQTVTLDYRDSTLDPRSGWVLRLGSDFAGLGGNETFVRAKVDTAYYIPLEGITGDRDWGIAITAGTGYLFNLSSQPTNIVDRFFLGGDNLRGFLDGGAGPHAAPPPGASYYADALGGRFIWTQSTELRFPLPLSPDLGLLGRTFVDIGALTGVKKISSAACGGTCPLADYPGPRVSAGVGVTWRSPFGLINLDFGVPIIKYPYDQLELFRVGFGTRF